MAKIKYLELQQIIIIIKRIVFLDFIHHLVFQEQTKLKKKIKNCRQKIKT
jgi:hypothetical protein